MKIIYFLLIIFFTCTANAANLFKKCFSHSGSDTCTSETTNNHALRWYATCNSTRLEGVAFCSDTPATNTGDAKTSINLSSVNYSGNCYCRIVSPFVSEYWVYAKLSGYNNNYCSQLCAENCSQYMQTNPTFRQNILGVLDD